MPVRRLRVQGTALDPRRREVIHLSVAIGRFFEALFYAILRVAGVAAGAILGVAVAGALLFLLARVLIGRKK
ncbi:membrane protein [Sphingomonas endophytica]|uniref:Membrane protein n=1 Tax=Sphingomonas endophytica TaxID=869719 RepID=A0A147HWK0_9SPHN|nr:membrane protein [Sphingomonas endophytica]